MMNLLAYADGAHDTVALAERAGISFAEAIPILGKLERAGVLRRTSSAKLDHSADTICDGKS